MLYIGIDIGKAGAITIIDKEQNVLDTIQMPLIKTELDYHRLFRILKDYEGKQLMVVFEKLGVIFGSSKRTAFSMGEQLGAIEMVCISLSLPYTEVPAKTWQKEMFQGIPEQTIAGTKKRDTKAMALLAVKRLYPNLKLTFGDRATKPHDGLIDSVLMAEYARRKF